MQRSERIALHSDSFLDFLVVDRTIIAYTVREDRVIGSMIIPLLQILYHYILCERNDSDEDYTFFLVIIFFFIEPIY